MEYIAENKFKQITLKAVVIKKDGTKIDLGTIADTKHKKGILEVITGKMIGGMNNG